MASRENENKELMATLTGQQLSKLKLKPQDTLLEVGSGSGRLTIPLAKTVKRVTVVEPSRNMMLHLQRNAENEGIYNIDYINKRWEDVEVGKDVARHDVVLASFSLLMVDLESALAKMDSAAKRAVYLFLSAECWMPLEIQYLVYGEPLTTNLSDHIIAFNLLNSMGISANVEIINYTLKRCFRTFDEAVNEFSNTYNVPTSKIDALKDHLQTILVKDAGKLWHIRNRKVAMIWWTKTD